MIESKEEQLRGLNARIGQVMALWDEGHTHAHHMRNTKQAKEALDAAEGQEVFIARGAKRAKGTDLLEALLWSVEAEELGRVLGPEDPHDELVTLLRQKLELMQSMPRR